MDADKFNTAATESATGASIHPLVPASMEIVCGTDFSKSAVQAADAAAALAARLREPLIILHAFDEPSRQLLPKELRDSLRTFEQQQLQAEAQRLHTGELVVRETFCDGAPSEVLTQFAARPNTRLVVVSSGRHTPAVKRISGSVAEHVTGSSPVPTLVVRNSDPLVEWAQGKRKLRVFVAADFSVASDTALGWVRWLRQVERCDVTVAYIELPLVTDSSLGAQPSPGAAPLLAMIERTEEVCFRRRVRSLLSTDRVRVCFNKGWGRSDAHLIEMARKERADLIIVGMSERHCLSRVAHHSVSRAIVRYAPMNVACIPSADLPTR
jgi:nucleotide-binding universal stress UspA family protein